MPGKQWVPQWIKDLFDGVDVSTDTAFTANSDALLPTQKAVKAYVTAHSGGGGALPVYDNTGASADYALAVGETAKITFSAVTTLLLHIATVPGVYEVEIISASTPTTAAAGASLAPNNGAVSGVIVDGTHAQGSTAGGDLVTNGTNINLGYGCLIRALLRVSTFTAAKHVLVDTLTVAAGPTYLKYNNGNWWPDTTTAWASLGTITFPLAQSGTVIIRRIL